MRMKTVKKAYKKPRPGIAFGYKVFRRGEGDLLHYEFESNLKLVRGEWLQAQSLENSGSSEYKTGFHVFVRKKDAQKWCEPEQIVVGVRCAGLLAIGTQKLYDEPLLCRVYSQIHIPKVRKKVSNA